MLDAINPPTSPYSVDIDMIDDSGAATPILSSQADDIILPSEDPESPTNPNATGTSSSTTTNTATNKINAGGATTTSTTKSSSSSSSSGSGVIGDSNHQHRRDINQVQQQVKDRVQKHYNVVKKDELKLQQLWHKIWLKLGLEDLKMKMVSI